MKKLFFGVICMAMLSIQHSFGQDDTKASTHPLLISYFGIKEALVAGNPTVASASATEFLKALASADGQVVKKDIRDSLNSDAASIAESRDIKLQRERFAVLSDNMIALAKSHKLSAAPLYEQYCPMKKASWLSSNKAIKNPYYGNAMLTCGSVKASL